eukprot:1152656-Pelagomonas_calceolata.AAC.2
MVLPCRAQQCCAQQVKARSLARFAGVKRSRAPYPCGLRSCVCMAWVLMDAFSAPYNGIVQTIASIGSSDDAGLTISQLLFGWLAHMSPSIDMINCVDT